MRALLVVAALLVAGTASVAAPAAAFPPVCLQYEKQVGPVTADVWLSCGPGATVTVCPPPPSTLPCGRATVGRAH